MAWMSLVVGYPVVENKSKGLMDSCFEQHLGNNTHWLLDLPDKLRHA